VLVAALTMGDVTNDRLTLAVHPTVLVERGALEAGGQR
jgi:hypothetical protein